MLEIHELRGRDVDPIDDVRRCFENFYTESYFNPLNGDWISDDYFRIIDLATQPVKLSVESEGKLNRSITRLNSKYPHIERRLGGSSLLAVYNDVAEQINAINSSDPDRSRIEQMQSGTVEVC